MRVDDERVRPVDERPPQLRAHHRRARVRGVDEPDAIARTRPRSREQDRRTPSTSFRPWRRRRTHRGRASGRSRTHRPPASAEARAEGLHGLLDRRVRVLGGHDDAVRRELPCTGERDQRGRPCPRCGHASPPEAPAARPPSRARLLRARSRPETFARGWRSGSGAPRGSPARARDGEVAEVARRLPVRHRRQEDLLDVAQHRREGLALLGRRRGQPSGQRRARPARAPAARPHARGNAPPIRAPPDRPVESRSSPERLLDLCPRARVQHVLLREPRPACLADSELGVRNARRCARRSRQERARPPLPPAAPADRACPSGRAGS